MTSDLINADMRQRESRSPTAPAIARSSGW